MRKLVFFLLLLFFVVVVVVFLFYFFVVVVFKLSRVIPYINILNYWVLRVDQAFCKS